MKKKKRKEPLTGYFTDPDIKTILNAPKDDKQSNKPASIKPVAIHMEGQSNMWGGQFGYASHHGVLCAHILSGPLWHKDKNGGKNNNNYISGLFDKKPFKAEDIAECISKPSIRIITISSKPMTPVPINHDEIERHANMSETIVLSAAGNHGKYWEMAQMESLSSPYLLPSILRVGEAKKDGTAVPQSQASGPAFICAHPFRMKKKFSYPYYATEEQVDNFVKWATDEGQKPNHKPFAKGEKSKKEKALAGTSFAAPHAGAMIMRHSADFDGIKPYDIIPATLLAAQENFPEAEKHFRNAAGIRFNEGQYGGGMLKSKPLKNKLKEVWDLHTHNVKTKGQSFSTPVSNKTETVQTDKCNKSELTIKTNAGDELLVNTVLTINFRKNMGLFGLWPVVPQHVHITSPSGTRVKLPLLMHKKRWYTGKKILTGYSTTALFGEAANANGGVWKIEAPKRFIGIKHRIEDAQLTTHSLHPKSPGAQLIKDFRKLQTS